MTGQPFNSTVSGTYFIAANDLNTLTIQGPLFGAATFAFGLDSTGNGRIIEYDDTTGQGSRGSGALRKQDPTAFSLSKLNGGYVFGMTGVDNSAFRFTDVGVFTLSNGNITNGACDINDGGTFQTCTFTGSLPAIGTQTGRAVSTIQSTNGTSHQAVYVVTASEMVMEQIDSVPGTQTPLIVGSVLHQSGTFNNGTLNGLSVLYYQDIHASDGADQSIGMIINFNGSGGGNLIAGDEDLAGVITQIQPGPASYTVTANGAVTFAGGNGPPVGFLVGPNRGFVVGTSSNSIFGIMEPQTGAPFSTASMSGTYAGGTLAPMDYHNAHGELVTGPADGLGTFTVQSDSSGPGGISQQSGEPVTYAIASNGRGTALTQGDQFPSVIYMISPTRWIVLLTNVDARMDVFNH